MILVVGGTGRLGSALVPLIKDDGEPVRIFARGASLPFPERADDGVELLRGDLASAADCARAVEGCTKVVFAASGFGLKKGGNPRSVDRDGALQLIDAAVKAGVEHFVMMSMHGAAPDGPIEFLRMKAAAEEALRSSGLVWTTIRMGANLDQFLVTMSESLPTKGRVVVFGSGQAPVTFTSTADAAELVRRVLREGSLKGQTVEWGTETHTFNELADALLAGAPNATVQRIPLPALRVMSVAARPVSPFLARMSKAALWMNGGGAEFDVRAGRELYPDIPVVGLRQLAG
ncbi:SDR family oxidoreductase [Sinomonas sp.]|uniref:SDR family oxidoreductase n=1 Tax=Sinomonas sp. TaxID=1914986 RepID=UPI003F820CEB